MKILHTVEFYHPSQGGMQEVVRQISEKLAKLGHKVTVATTKLRERKKRTINGVKIEEFDIKGNLVRGLTGETEKYKKFLINSDFDIITNFAAQQWASDLAYDLLDKIRAKKVFVPTGFSGLYLPEYKDYFKNMKVWMKKYDMNVFVSNNYRDINFANKNRIKKIELIPDGASEKEFLSTKKTNIRKKLHILNNHFLILHIGSHTGLKGHKEAINIFKESNITNATFLIIGNDYGNGCATQCLIQEKLFNLSLKRLIDKKRLIVKTLNRQETIDSYKEADLFLFPSNLERSGLVLFESMASKTPFLVTDVGWAKEIIERSGAGLLLPTRKDKKGYSYAKIEESVKILEEIYRNPTKRKIMVDSGYKVWHSKFTWEIIVKKYENVYKKLAQHPNK